MSAPSSNNCSSNPTGAKTDLELDSLLELLRGQDAAMRTLFAKALNLYVSPGAAARTDSEKLAQLRQAIEDSVK